MPCRPNLPFLISDIRALRRSGLSAGVPECQKLKMVGYGAKHSKCNHMMTPGFKGLMLSKVKARTGQTDRQTDATKDIIKPHSRTIIVISCQLSVLYLIHRAWFQNHEHQSKAVEIYNFAGLIAAVTVVFIFPWFHAIPSHLRGFSRGDFTIRLQLRATKRRGRHKFVNFLSLIHISEPTRPY